MGDEEPLGFNTLRNRLDMEPTPVRFTDCLLAPRASILDSELTEWITDPTQPTEFIGYMLIPKEEYASLRAAYIELRDNNNKWEQTLKVFSEQSKVALETTAVDVADQHTDRQKA